MIPFKKTTVAAKGEILLVFLLIVFSKLALAQEMPPKHTFYAELAFRGPVYSINYDRVFKQEEKFAFSYRLGFSITKEALALPLGFNVFTGKNSAHLELSLSVVPYIEQYETFLSKNDHSDTFIYLIPGLGYRYQKPSGGLFFKVVLSPLILLDPPSNDFWNMDPKLFGAGSFGGGWSF